MEYMREQIVRFSDQFCKKFKTPPSKEEVELIILDIIKEERRAAIDEFFRGRSVEQLEATLEILRTPPKEENGTKSRKNQRAKAAPRKRTNKKKNS
jgi:hypothetical protein